ncbi:DUF3800 domain-containing protein [Erwinia sp. S63]|uniref:DUF3800 domain-containing protein n=1 Tax=Erwiniaceae TaxID=1903409 RepID=UPI00190DB764|nr:MULTISPECIES: DUF3800 domain-containing protein [Erwiniaceae]MBK0004638.1 DUF3800 domain-containing protein [Erwinia sp. S38]MBK0099294.1 DUF3800 domain-containing protein [Erwinia sp. S63]MBK0127284.1 DUF3800 domain-containing protein [Pantoea sp. S61]
MKIYVDEAGLFNPHTVLDNIDKAWGTVGAVTIPHKSEKKVISALNDLKTKMNIPLNEEIKKNRPDPSTNDFSNFVDELRDANCSLHAMTVNRASLNNESSSAHKEDQIKARKNYYDKIKSNLSPEQQNEYLSELEDINVLINTTGLQEYNQIVIQSKLISFMLDKTMTFYGRVSPRELTRFEWIFDRKNESPKKFELLYSKFMPATVQVDFIRETRGVAINKEDIVYFTRNYGNKKAPYGMGEDEIEFRKNIYSVDHSSIAENVVSFDFKKLLNDKLSFSNSKEHAGLQVADLLISAVNRYLKGNVDDVNKSAEILGSLFLNSPRDDVPSIPHINFYNEDIAKPEIDFNTLRLINAKTRILYNPIYRRNFTKNIQDLIERQNGI